jgi:serine phosphatase RsbU (regulator of sigma subunit)
MTDGVIEAMNPANELFGFERSHQISGQPAASIAQQAPAFGQNDDITVLAIEFAGVAQAASSVRTAKYCS